VRILRTLLIFALALITFTSCGAKSDMFKVGHGGGYLSAALYALTAEQTAQTANFDVQTFTSSSDVAYALLSGSLDAGFVEVDKIVDFSQLGGFERLMVVGKVTYPYGAVVILRKGLNLRLNELAGLKIAVSSPECKLLAVFESDAERLNADLSDVKYEYMAFDAMLPALEAGVVDAAIIKGHYSVTALNEGHTVLYQNWEVAAGDECCPAIIDQTALVLLVQRDKESQVKPLIEALEKTGSLTPNQLRQAVADNTVIDFEVLQGQPVPEFSVAGNELIEILGEHRHEQEH